MSIRNWTDITLAPNMTVAELRLFLLNLHTEIERREYCNVYVYSVVNRLDIGEGAFMIAGSCRSLHESETIYFSTGSRNWADLPSALNLMLDEKLPDKTELLKRKFNKSFSVLAEVADKLGEYIPSYNAFAEALRNSRKSNLVEHQKKGDS